MRKLIARLRAEFAYYGQRLNYLQALVVAYVVAAPGSPREIVNALVPEAYRPIAAAIAGFVSFLLVRSAANRDEKKAVQNAGR